MMGFLSKLQARKELNRLEDRYVRRNNRNAWKSDFEYVNGEYVFKNRQQVDPPASRTAQKQANPNPRFSTARPPTDSSYGSEASKPSSAASSSSKPSKRFSTSFVWR
ncbi:uncharacterized protein PV09_03557 [Verruconis gallopava]|uniref:Uncharacterized protein n=1 Tax=Verruconis gallopava TaxID=253628 RepID=A0A0D1XSG0_9PEZI|nr:uncharacterized protein PV09_03557 [Verruconis gallopava]KIW05696.1 hypothetical protein PV09_03557 [Verruconis gallopava]